MVKERADQLDQALVRVEAFDPDQRFQELSKLNQAMPVGIGDQDLLVTLEGMTMNNGLLLNSVNINEIKDAKKELLALQGEGSAAAGAVLASRTSEKYKKVTLTLDLLGDYSSFKGFLKACEQNVRVLNVKEIKFTAGNTSSSGSAQPGNTFRFLVDLETYYLPEN